MQTKNRISSGIWGRIGLSCLIALAAVAANADTVRPPGLAPATRGAALQYTEGYYAPGNYSNSAIYIADSSWQLCALRGVQAVGSDEGAHTYQSGGNWYLRFWKKTWPLGLYWYCVK